LLKIYNTLTRGIENFQLKENKQIKMFTCGPSTYQPAHIGNYRTFLFEDTLQRYLEYLGYKVTRLITLTDVEDKAIQQAKKENLTVEQLSSKNEAIFFSDFQLLKIKKPDFTVKASTAIDQAVTLIQKLVNNGFAYLYKHKGAANVYFNPLKFKDFGKLAHLDKTKWPKGKRRFHKDTYPGSPWNKGDFVLWHGCPKSDVCWETPIGTGRPAWNIQDAAIITKNFGFTIDIACGGIDNLVRHHDYTIAIIESISGKKFSRYWLHGAHLNVEGEKMSKSKGNVFYPRDLIKKGYTGQQIRFYLVYACYRKTLNFTLDKFAETIKKLSEIKIMISNLQQNQKNISDSRIKQLSDMIVAGFEEEMNDDLDVKAAFDSLYRTITELYIHKEKINMENKKEIDRNLRRVDSVLQCIF